MDHINAINYSIPNRVGFHYFPDSLHYGEKDLSLWLPRLQDINARWLVINSPTNRAVPEEFINAVSKEKINIIVDFNLPLIEEIPWRDVETLLSSYGKWGVKYALLNQRPNSQKAWGIEFYKQPALVESHVEQFIQFANLALENAIKPVFSPLVPGGDYWDLAFLENALKILAKSAPALVVNKMALSAYAWDWERPLDWGAGGSKQWPDVKPYKVLKNSQDQRGFRTFDWYLDCVKSVMGKKMPIILFQAGVAADPLDSSPKIIPPDNEKQLLIYQLLNEENVYVHGSSGKLIKAIPPEVLACNFYLLSADDATHKGYAWFASSGTPLKSAQFILEKYSPKKDKTGNPAEIQKAHKSPQFQNGRYILIAESMQPRMPEILQKLHPYITRHKPLIGFSSGEAEKSAYILAIGSKTDFPNEDIQALQKNGNLVQVVTPEKIHTFITKVQDHETSN